MVNSILKLAQELISVPSTRENTDALNKVIGIAKKELNEMNIKEYNSNNVPSLLASNQPGAEKHKIILNAHMDVVPANENQYKPYIKDGKLYGRGAYDMKSAAAAMILVFKEVAPIVKYPLALQLVTDEEIGGYNGAKYQVEKGVKTDFIIAGENTSLVIVNKSKGLMWTKISAKGRSAHGAYPWNGENAIWKIKKVLDVIEKDYPIPAKAEWRTTINVASVQTSNTTANKVPDDCTLTLDVRYIAEERNTIEKYLTSLSQYDVTVDIYFKDPVHFTPPDNPFIKELQKHIKKNSSAQALIEPRHGASDVRHFNANKMDGIEFGPVGFGHHTDEEWVDIKSLEQYYAILKSFLLSYNN